MPAVRNLPTHAGEVRDTGSIPGSGRSSGGGHGNLLWYFHLENPVDKEPGGLQSIGSQRVGHDRSNLECMHTYSRRSKQLSGNPCIYNPLSTAYAIRNSRVSNKHLLKTVFP